MTATGIAPALGPAETQARTAVRFGSAEAAPGTTPRSKVRQAAEEFEAVFLTQMLEQIWQDVETDGLFGADRGNGIYRSMMLQEYGRGLAKQGGVGIAGAVERELLRLQEIRPAPDTGPVAGPVAAPEPEGE